MRVPVDRGYDGQALATAKSWTYKPATLDGVPVKFLWRVQVVLTPAH